MNITTIPGYMPMRHDTALQDIFRRTAVDLVGEQATLGRPAATGAAPPTWET